MDNLAELPEPSAKELISQVIETIEEKIEGEDPTPLTEDQRNEMLRFLDDTFRPSLTEHLQKMSHEDVDVESVPFREFAEVAGYLGPWKELVPWRYKAAIADAELLWTELEEPVVMRKDVKRLYKSVIDVLQWMDREDLVTKAKSILAV